MLLCLFGFGAMTTAKADNTFYGALEKDGKTLKCYYDDKKAERSGSGNFKDEWKKVVTRVIFDESVKDFHPTNSMASLFSHFEELWIIENFNYLNTEDVKLMNHVFNDCKKLEFVDLSNFKTGSATTMKSMFRHCASLKSINVKGFDTKNVTDMSFMFDSCVNVTTLDVSKFATYNVTDMQSMFRNCSSLAYLDLSNFNTYQVKNMSHMFHGCSNLPFLYVNSFDTRRVTTMRSMFNGCSGIGMLDVSMLATGKVKDMSYMFYNCSGLNILYCFSDTRNVTNMSYMFKNCKKLTKLDLYSFYVQNVDSMFGMFENCSDLETIYTDQDWKSTSKTTSVKSAKMFSGCEKLTGGYGTKYDADKTDITYARPDKDGVKGYFTDITETHEIYGVLSADGKTFTLRYGEDRVANKGVLPDEWGAYEYMEQRENVETIVLDESMDVARPATIAYWFDDFWSVTSIENIQYLHTDNVTDMTWLFNDCSRLESIDLSSFNTSKVTKMKGMFKGCKALKELDVNTFDMAKVKDTQDMFNGCSELTTIRCIKDWSSLSITQNTNMFKNCKKLVGSNGTAYDEAHLDVEYARPDGKNGKKGYFTIAQYQVTFLDYNDDVLLVETVVEGDDAKGPETDPEREGYDFTGWDQSLENITSDLTVTATYTLKTYVVTIKKPENGEIVVLTEDIYLNSVERGTVIYLEAVPDYGYGLVGWTNYDPETGLEVTSDTTVTATFGVFTYRVTVDEEIEHGVIHVLEDEIDLANVLIGTTLHFEAVPHEGYELDHWINYDEETGLTVTSDTTVSAVFRPLTFVVTIEAAENGHIEVDEEDIDLEHVPYGTVLHFTAVPDPGYQLDGWNIEFDPDEGLKVTEDVWVAATFMEAVYNVTFVDFNGDPIGETQELKYGEDAVAPEAPEVEGYTFIGWDGDYTNVTEDMVVFPHYEINVYTVTFLDKDGNPIGEPQTVDYGQAAVAPTAPEEKGYEFTGWDKAFDNVTEDLTVQALYEAIEFYTLTVVVEPAEGGTYMVTGLDENQQGAFFAEFVITATPNEGYEFVGWKDGDMMLDSKELSISEVLYGDRTITILFKKKTGTGVDQLPMTNDQLPIKFLREGVLYIERDGKTYDVTGRVISRN